MNFPDIPESGSNYMSLESGENRIRILGEPIFGIEYWTPEKKPIRVRWFDRETINPATPGADKQKYFWALPVWNYQTGRVNVLELTQKTIMKAIKALSDDEEWGDATKYDIVINRTGESLNTEYAVTPKIPKELPAEAKNVWASVKGTLVLDAIFTGGDPFGGTEVPEVEEKTEKIAEEVSEAAAEEIDISGIDF